MSLGMDYRGELLITSCGTVFVPYIVSYNADQTGFLPMFHTAYHFPSKFPILRFQEEADFRALGLVVRWEGRDAWVWVDLGLQEYPPIFLLLPVNAREATDFLKKEIFYTNYPFHKCLLRPWFCIWQTPFRPWGI